jgi:hypothetical protein
MQDLKTRAALTLVVGVALVAMIAIATLIENSKVFAVLIVGLGVIRFVSLQSLLPKWMHPIFYVLAIGCLTTICLTF